MTKEETAKRIKVMQAYVDGKEIEYFDKDAGEWISLNDIEETPRWSPGLDYRVKLERKYRPFKNADEFLAAQKEHGLYIHCQDPYGYVLVQRVDEAGVYWSYLYDEGMVLIHFNELLSDFYHWHDGTPCGILEE